MFIGDGEMLVLTREKFARYARLKSTICNFGILVGIVVFICEIMMLLHIDSVDMRERAMLFCGFVVLCVCAAWLAVFHILQFRYGYKKSPTGYIFEIVMSILGAILLFIASAVQFSVFIEYALTTKVFQDIMFGVIAVMATFAIGFVLGCIITLLYCWSIDHRLWRGYLDELDVNDKPITFTEYCELFAD